MHSDSERNNFMSTCLHDARKVIFTALIFSAGVSAQYLLDRAQEKNEPTITKRLSVLEMRQNEFERSLLTRPEENAQHHAQRHMLERDRAQLAQAPIYPRVTGQRIDQASSLNDIERTRTQEPQSAFGQMRDNGQESDRLSLQGASRPSEIVNQIRQNQIQAQEYQQSSFGTDSQPAQQSSTTNAQRIPEGQDAVENSNPQALDARAQETASHQATDSTEPQAN